MNTKHLKGMSRDELLSFLTILRGVGARNSLLRGAKRRLLIKDTRKIKQELLLRVQT